MLVGVLRSGKVRELSRAASKIMSAHNIRVGTEVPPPILQVLVDVWCINGVCSQIHKLLPQSFVRMQILQHEIMVRTLSMVTFLRAAGTFVSFFLSLAASTVSGKRKRCRIKCQCITMPVCERGLIFVYQDRLASSPAEDVAGLHVGARDRLQIPAAGAAGR